MIEVEKEVEIKLMVDEQMDIKSRLTAAGAVCLGEPYTQTTLGYFSADSIQKGIFPRIRDEGGKIILTVKTKNGHESETGYKERMEYSLPLESVKQGENILFALGYVDVRSFTKERQEWSLLDTKVTIDKLYFGTFLEIEGEKNNIEDVINKLSLDGQKRITKSYLGLEDDYKNNKLSQN